MSRIQFRQKTEEELQAEAAERQKRNATAPRIEEHPSPAGPGARGLVHAPAGPPAADEAPGFALDGEPEQPQPQPKKKRKK